jgi:hypothetical protein
MGTQTHTHERCRGHRSTITPLVRASRHAMYRPPLSPRAALHARLAADLPPCRRQTHAPDGGVPPTHTFGTEPVVPRRITCGLLGAAEHVEQERLSGHSLLEEARTTHLLVCAGAPSLRTGTTISLCVVVAIAWSRLWRGVSSRVGQTYRQGPPFGSPSAAMGNLCSCMDPVGQRLREEDEQRRQYEQQQQQHGGGQVRPQDPTFAPTLHRALPNGVQAVDFALDGDTGDTSDGTLCSQRSSHSRLRPPVRSAPCAPQPQPPPAPVASCRWSSTKAGKGSRGGDTLEDTECAGRRVYSTGTARQGFGTKPGRKAGLARRSVGQLDTDMAPCLSLRSRGTTIPPSPRRCRRRKRPCSTWAGHQPTVATADHRLQATATGCLRRCAQPRRLGLRRASFCHLPPLVAGRGKP